MIRMFVRHSVENFATWKQAYDEFDIERRGMGVQGHVVFQSTSDSNEVTAWHDFGDLKTAQSFAAAERLREVMAAAGVVGEPTIWFTTRA